MNWLHKISQVTPPWTQTWEEFIDYHKTGFIPGGYGEGGMGEDLSHYNDRNQQGGHYSPAKYPILLDKKTFDTHRYGEVEVEFRQSGEGVRYVKHEPPGYSEIMRDELGLAVYLNPEEMIEKDLPDKDTTIMMFSGGKCIGHVGNSFGATELYVVREFQGAGIGPAALKLYMETYPSQSHKTPQLGQMTWQGIATAKKTWMQFVEDAAKKGEPVPDNVMTSYQTEKQRRVDNPPHREVYDIPTYKIVQRHLDYRSGLLMDDRNVDLQLQMGFDDIEILKRGPGGRVESWIGGGNWDDAVAFVESLGYKEESYRTYDLKMDYSGEHGIILPADA